MLIVEALKDKKNIKNHPKHSYLDISVINILVIFSPVFLCIFCIYFQKMP